MDLYGVLTAIVSLFGVGIAGFAGRRWNIITQEMADNIPKVVTHITMPALFLVAMQLPFSWDRIQDIGYLALTAVVAYGVQILIALIFPYFIGEQRSPDKGVYQFMMIFSNAAFMGFPVLLSIFGQEAIFYGAIFNIPFNALVFTLGVYLMDREKSSFHLKKLLSPALVATGAGFFLFLFSVSIPEIIAKPLSMLGELTTPLSMLFIGASLANVHLGKIFLNRKLYLVTLFRLLLIPLLVLVLLRPWIYDELILGIPVVIMSMPVAAMCAIIAKAYGNNVELAAEGTFMTTLLSMGTIPVVIWILSRFG